MSEKKGGVGNEKIILREGEENGLDLNVRK